MKHPVREADDCHSTRLENAVNPANTASGIAILNGNSVENIKIFILKR